MKKIPIILSITLILLGCSQGSDPVLPDGGTHNSDYTSHALWGWAELICDTEEGSVELVPSRNPSIHLNVLNPIMLTHGMQVVMYPGLSDPGNGLFVMDVSLTHPFGGQEKLSGFDVKGILISPGTFAVDALVLSGLGETELLNRDGLTRWWNPTEFTGDGLLGYSPGTPGAQDPGLLTSILNPYKLFADVLNETSPLGDLILPLLDDPTGRAVFSAGTTNTRRYEIQFPVSGGPVVIFNYAVDACWAAPVPNPPDYVPDDFPMAANQPEAFRVQVIFPENTLTYLEGGLVTGELRIRANVSDWQGMAAADIQNEIGTVTAYAPTLLDQPIVLSYVSESFDHATYEADATSHLLSLNTGDSHLLLIEVETDSAGDYTQGGLNIGPASPVCAYTTEWIEIQSVTCLADGNDDFTEAEPIDLGGEAFGTLCRPGGALTDYKDFFVFEVPPSVTAYGSVGLFCDEETTGISIFNSGYVKIAESWVSDGYTTIDDLPELTPGTYYFRVLTLNENEMVFYDIYNYYSLDPCGDAIAFTYETQVDDPPLSNIYTGRRSTLVYLDNVWVVYSEGISGSQTIFCKHSTDGGLSFGYAAQVNMMEIACSRQWPAITRGSNGNLYCAWIDFLSGSGEPFVSRSTDNGSGWSLEVNIYDFETGGLQPNNYPKAVQIDADDNGRLHVVWLDKRNGNLFDLFYSYSDDEGLTWEPAELIDESPKTIQGSDHSIDMDVSPGGTVVVAWTDRRYITDPPLTSLDIFFDTRDIATPFGTDIMINPPVFEMEQTSPGIAIADDGTIHATWVDRRNDGAFGGSNPWNTWELYYARSEDSGSSWIAETEIQTAEGYSTSQYMQCRIDVSPWGNPYIYFMYNYDDLRLSKSCDGGNTWDSEITVYPDSPDTFVMSNISFDLGVDGSVFTLHADTRNDPGPDYTQWNLWLGFNE